MTAVQTVVRVFGLGWLLFVASLLAAAVLRGQMPLRGLIRHKTRDGLGGVSLLRVFLLLLSLTTASLYTSSAVGRVHARSLPRVPCGWLVALGVANGLYLRSRFVSSRRLRAPSPRP